MKNIGWYVAHSHIINVDEWDEMTTGNQRWTGRVWGWDCGSGITAMVIGVVVALVIGSMQTSRLLREWTWIGLFATALMGIPVFVLSLVWIIVCPGDNISPILSQGVHVGPFLAMAGRHHPRGMRSGGRHPGLGLKRFAGAFDRAR